MNLLRNFELVFWIAALTALAFLPLDQHHFTLCPLGAMGLKWCPGCGLGRAVACILHGEVEKSVQYHILGLPALIILVGRIFSLSKKFLYLS
ncbi:DUF2752 domain-containing protein [Desertivirga xinjiangensis]|uniref:DUF2752 domain-containing protein n=1 Tax=Desertivirga xinjiangensis TaxID=539206 RepID=UPI0021087942|nr:DUF2752 domain-containing protein [Pedobacter xinjiangensis]